MRNFTKKFTMDLGQLFWTTGLNTSGLKKDSAKATGIVSKMSGSVGGALGGIAKMAISPTGAITAIGGAMFKLGKDAMEFSKEFNTAMLEVQTISTATQEDFAGISESIVNISLQGVNDDAIGLSKAMYQIVSAGYDGAEGLAVLEASAKAATGGVTDTITAADGLTTVLNAWGMAAEDVTGVSDDFFTTVRLGKTTMGELGQNIAKVAPLAAASGVSFKEVASATATMTGSGTKTAEVMTQLKAAMIAMNKTLGDGWSDTMSLSEGMQAMSDKVHGSATELVTLTGSSEAAMAIMANTGMNAEKAASQFAEYGENVGEANKALVVMQEGADVMWKQVGNQFKAAMVNVGDGLLEASKGLASFLSATLTASDSMGDSYEGIGESVDSFTERFKVLRNEGSSFMGGLAGAVVKSNDKIQSVVDSEKAQITDTQNEIKAIQEEYARMSENGASETALADYKKNLIDSYADIQKARAEDLADEESKQKKEAIAGALLTGGTSLFYTSKKDVKDAQDKLDAAKSLTDAVAQLGVESAKKEAEEKTEIQKAELDKFLAEKTAAEIEANKGVLERLNEQLKEIKDKEGTFINAELEAENADLVLAKLKEIDAYNLEVQQAQRITTTSPLMESKSVGSVTTTAKGAKAALAPMKKLTAEQIKQLNATKSQADTEIEIEEKREEITEKTVDGLYDAADISAEMAGAIGLFNEDLGDAVYEISDLAGGAADFASNIVSGNWLGAITSGVGLISTLFSSSVESEEDLNAAAMEMNDTLIDRINILVSAGLLTPIEGASAESELLSSNLELAKEKLDNFYHAFVVDGKRTMVSISEMMNAVYGDDWSTANLQDATSDLAAFADKLEELGINDYKYAPLAEYTTFDDEGMNTAINDIYELQTQINDLDDSMDSLSLGFTSSDISDSIVDGIMSGLKTAEGGIGDFSDTFSDMLKTAVSTALLTSINTADVEKLTANIQSAMADGLSDEELADLEQQYADIVVAAEENAKAFESITGDLSEAATQEGLSGAFSAATEETTGLLEAQFNALRINTLSIIDIMAQHGDYLSSIADNTYDTTVLIRKTNTILTSIQSKSSSSGSYV